MDGAEKVRFNPRGEVARFKENPRGFLQELESSDPIGLVNTAIKLEDERLRDTGLGIEGPSFPDGETPVRTNVSTATVLRDIAIRLAVQRLNPAK